MLKLLSSILFLSFSSLSYADVCDIPEVLLNKECSSEYFEARNMKQLNEYLSYGKYKDGKLLNLNVNFNIKEKGVAIVTTCDLKINKSREIYASQIGICLKGKTLLLEGSNHIHTDKKAPILLGALNKVTLRTTQVETKGDLFMGTLTYLPFDGEVLISKETHLSANNIYIGTPSSIIINDESKLRSSNIVLNAGNCEISNIDDRDDEHERDHDREIKKFKPRFSYTGTCNENPIPTQLKISSIADQNDSLKINYSISGAPSDLEINWKFDREFTSLKKSPSQSYLFPGRHLAEAVIVGPNGFFRKIGSYKNVSPNKFNKGQTALFQFTGLKKNLYKVTALIGYKKFTLTRSDKNPELYFGEIPSDSAGNKLLLIPELNYKGSVNLVVLPAINNPDLYISKSIDQLSNLLNSINVANQSYLNSKLSLQNLLEELKNNIASLSPADKQKAAEYLQANIFADFQGLTSLKNIIKEKPSTIFGLFIISAYADDVSDFIIKVTSNMKSFALSNLKLIGVDFIAIGALGIAKLPGYWKSLGVISIAAGYILLTSKVHGAQALIENIHNLNPNSLYLRVPSQISSGQVATFSLWGQAVPLESIPAATPLISDAITAKNNANIQLKDINTQINYINSNLGFLGFSSQIEPLPELKFPGTRFPTALSTQYIDINSVQLISSEDGQASILEKSISGNNILIKFNSAKTQKAILRVTFVNTDFGINKNVDTEILIQVPPKATFTYSNNNLKVDFDATDSENPEISGLKYIWDFGDGTTETAYDKKISHNYTAPGIYNVSLRVETSTGAYSTFESKIEASKELAFFIKVAPNGTYLRTDSDDIDFDTEHNPPLWIHYPKPATIISLTALYNDPNLNIMEGDTIQLQAIGDYQVGQTKFGFTDTATGMAAVFASDSSFLFPGEGSDFFSYISPPTFSKKLPTDIPQDFIVPYGNYSKMIIPYGATKIMFTPQMANFSQKIDPDNDYGVWIKLKIIRGVTIPLN